jgi:hypothetical protein
MTSDSEVASPHNKAPFWVTTQRIWEGLKLQSTTFHWLLIEILPRPPPPTQPNTEMMHCYGNGRENIFANCVCCTQKDFTGTNYPHPYGVPLSHPATARLGRCGCVVCNGCVQATMRSSQDESAVPCPYCTRPYAFCRQKIYWILNNDVMIAHIDVLEANRDTRTIEQE